MLVTLLVANSIKIANHNLDATASYIDNLSIRSLVLRKGLATDVCAIDVPRQALDEVDPLIYLTTGNPCDIFVFVDGHFNQPVWTKAMSGYIASVAEKQNDLISFKVASKYSFYQEQLFMPKVSHLCQNQIYSSLCGLDKSNFSVTFPSVVIDCLTGKVEFSISPTSLTCNGTSINLANQMLNRTSEDLEQAYVILGGMFKSRIIGLTDDAFYLDLNFTDKTITTSLTIILSCDKSYGMCYKKFSNISKFFGFANIAQQSKNYNIFTSNALDYCGDYEDQPVCSLDDNIFGVSL